MQYNQFGNTELQVSVLGFGAGEIGDFNIEDKKVEQVLNFALDNGINLIDTARGYYASEDRIGRFISHRRKEFVLSTKVGYGIQNEPDWSYNSVSKGVDEALKTLRTDYIDIVHLHSCPLDVLQTGEVIEALLKAKEQGKIRCVAYSGENEELNFAVKSGAFDSVQTSFNICEQNNLYTVFPTCIKQRLGVIAKRSIANAPWLYKNQPYGQYVEEYWKRFVKMDFVFTDEWFENAIRFTAFTEGVNSAIVGTTNIEHLKANIKYVEKGKLPDIEYFNIIESFKIHNENWLGQI